MLLGRSLGVYFGTLAIALAVVGARLRGLALAEAPFALWLPFLRPLLSSVFEIALLVAVPASALGAWAAGASLRFALLGAALLATLSVAAALWLDPGAVAPGRLAQELLDAARVSCPVTRERRVHVPLVGLDWTCPERGSPRVSGPAPLGGGSRFKAASLQVSPDLRELAFSQLELSLPAKAPRPKLRLEVARARISGLAPWGRPATTPLLARLTSSGAAAALTLLAGFFVLRRFQLGYAFGATLGAAAGMALFGVRQWLDRTGGGGSLYWLSIAAGPLVIACAGLCALAVAHGLARRRAATKLGNPPG